VDSTNTLVNTTPSATFPLLIKTERPSLKDEGKIYVADFSLLPAGHLSKNDCQFI
jgi:hypothetical protein